MRKSKRWEEGGGEETRRGEDRKRGAVGEGTRRVGGKGKRKVGGEETRKVGEGGDEEGGGRRGER